MSKVLLTFYTISYTVEIEKPALFEEPLYTCFTSRKLPRRGKTKGHCCDFLVTSLLLLRVLVVSSQFNSDSKRDKMSYSTKRMGPSSQNISG